MHPLLRCPIRMVAMSAGYALAGPIGGLIGLGAAVWISWDRPSSSPAGTSTLPPHVRDAYRRLGVKPAVDNTTLQAAYRRLMSRHHPDKLGPDASCAERESARETTIKIRAAYDLLRKRRGL